MRLHSKKSGFRSACDTFPTASNASAKPDHLCDLTHSSAPSVCLDIHSSHSCWHSGLCTYKARRPSLSMVSGTLLHDSQHSARLVHRTIMHVYMEQVRKALTALASTHAWTQAYVTRGSASRNPAGLAGVADTNSTASALDNTAASPATLQPAPGKPPCAPPSSVPPGSHGSSTPRPCTWSTASAWGTAPHTGHTACWASPCCCGGCCCHCCCPAFALYARRLLPKTCWQRSLPPRQHRCCQHRLLLLLLLMA
jgi:hypothetical protein